MLGNEARDGVGELTAGRPREGRRTVARRVVERGTRGRDDLEPEAGAEPARVEAQDQAERRDGERREGVHRPLDSSAGLTASTTRSSRRSSAASARRPAAVRRK